MTLRRGGVVWVDLDPTRGSEVGRRRPAVILQNEQANRSSPTVTVLPITSSTDRVYPFQVRLPVGAGGLTQESKVLCEQIRTISRDRIVGHLGDLDDETLDEIRKALDRHLWL